MTRLASCSQTTDAAFTHQKILSVPSDTVTEREKPNQTLPCEIFSGGYSKLALSLKREVICIQWSKRSECGCMCVCWDCESLTVPKMKPITGKREEKELSGISSKAFYTPAASYSVTCAFECMLMTHWWVTPNALMEWEPAALMLIAWKFCCPWLHFFLYLSGFPEIIFLGVEAERRDWCGRIERFSDVAVTPTGQQLRLIRSYIT